MELEDELKMKDHMDERSYILLNISNIVVFKTNNPV